MDTNWCLSVGSVGGYNSFLVPILVINAYQAATEGQYLAEGYQNGVVYLTRWRCYKPRHQHRAPEGAQCQGGD